MATLVGVSMAVKRGILFKEATFLETMAKCDILAIDKTGTLTEGRPSVTKEKLLDGFDPSLLLALVKTSNHPISKGIQSYLESEHEILSPIALSNIKSVESKGLKASYQDKELIGGNALFMNEEKIIINNINTQDSLFYFSIDGILVGHFELADTLRVDAKETIGNIQDLGINVLMLTGDHHASAHKIASQLGISEVHATLLPQDKASYIKKYQSQGHVVVMAGDGINDAVALASSDVAIAMGKGADVAINASDIVLLDDNIERIYEAFRLSKRTFRAVKENLGLSLLYNVIAVPLAVIGLVNPLIAALSMSLSSLLVVGNSMRIKSLKYRDTNE